MPQPPLSTGRELRSWMQQIEDRLTSLEGRRSVTVGGWVLAENAAGDVVARHVASGTEVVLASVPAAP